MVDQEIDALLVGALYGELGPVDQARLAAHLESHPTDRSALDDLKSTRQTLRESRIFELQLDPPPSVSAMLVQEAARRAPRKGAEPGESWFMRFVRTFAAHPAMAAAATLVVVVGVAGSLYVSKGSELAAPRGVDSSVAERGSAVAADVAPAKSVQVATDHESDGIPVEVDDKQLDNGNLRQRGGDVATTTVSKTGYAPTHAKAPEAKLADMPVAEPTVAEHRMTGFVGGKQAIVVTGHDQEPKDLDRGEANSVRDEREQRGAATTLPPPPPPAPEQQAAAGDDYKVTDPKAKVSAADRPRSTPSPVATTEAPAPTAPGAGGAASTGTTPQNGAPTDNAWAREQHARVAALVRNGRCQDAAPIAVQIQSRAPDYYSANVASDRALKQCMQYIAGAVEKAAERSKPAAAKAAK